MEPVSVTLTLGNCAFTATLQKEYLVFRDRLRGSGAGIVLARPPPEELAPAYATAPAAAAPASSEAGRRCRGAEPAPACKAPPREHKPPRRQHLAPRSSPTQATPACDTHQQQQ
ncbi:unnamed protein product [Symbiodinium sp. CCMP2592]|nr:unnamed protein product [Symbiodinium sp. CCMP2592]